jgi:hypothetical protein
MNLGAGPATITLTTSLALPNTRNITIDGTLSGGGARVQISGAGGSGGYLKPTLGTPENAASVGFANVDFTDIGFDATANELGLTNVSMASTRPSTDGLQAFKLTFSRATLRSVRISGFRPAAYYGGAIFLLGGATLDAVDLTVAGCAAYMGGAIYASEHYANQGVYPRIGCDRCTLVNNTGAAGGGAAYLYKVRAIFSRCRFAFNQGSNGGAIATGGSPSTVTVTRSHFYANVASYTAGAIGASGAPCAIARSSTMWPARAAARSTCRARSLCCTA